MKILRFGLALVVVLFSVQCHAMERPYSTYENLKGATLVDVKREHPRLSSLRPVKNNIFQAFVFEDFPFAVHGPLTFPDAMFYFEGNRNDPTSLKLIGIYSFLELDNVKTREEAKAEWEYHGFISWANNALSLKGGTTWRDGNDWVTLDLDKIGSTVTLGIWWGDRDFATLN